MSRVTLADIAREAGVSKGAVSLALNGRPGVSADTRARVVDVARRLGFHPDSNARALAGARAGMMGLALRRPPSTLGVEPFYMELIGGIEAELGRRSYALLLQMTAGHAEELALYRRWAGDHRVDGVLLCDVRDGDPRVPVLAQLGTAAVIIGPPRGEGWPPSLWSDDERSTAEAVEHLAELGHRRIGRVTGLPDLAHTAIRTRALAAACARLGLPAPLTETGDYTGGSGARATRRLLGMARPPTAVVYDNDVMAVAGLSAARELGVDVPEQLSVIAWDDSAVCAAVHPALTALSRDVAGYGRRAAEMLLAAVEGAEVASGSTAPARLVVRASTAPPVDRSTGKSV